MKKISILLASLGFMIWLGVTIAKSVIAYDLFLPFNNDLILKSIYSSDIMFHSVYLYTSLTIYATVGYISFLFFGLIYIIKDRKQIRAKGWLFISIILTILSMPYYIYEMYLNSGLSNAIFNIGITEFADTAVKNYFLHIYQNPYMSMWSSISFLITITIVAFVVFKPLDKLKD